MSDPREISHFNGAQCTKYGPEKFWLGVPHGDGRWATPEETKVILGTALATKLDILPGNPSQPKPTPREQTLAAAVAEPAPPVSDSLTGPRFVVYHPDDRFAIAYPTAGDEEAEPGQTAEEKAKRVATKLGGRYSFIPGDVTAEVPAAELTPTTDVPPTTPPTTPPTDQPPMA